MKEFNQARFYVNIGYTREISPQLVSYNHDNRLRKPKLYLTFTGKEGEKQQVSKIMVITEVNMKPGSIEIEVSHLGLRMIDLEPD